MRFDPSSNIRKEHINAYSSAPIPDLEQKAVKAFANPPPAITQPAKKDWRYYESAIIAGWQLYDSYKSSGEWKQQYKTWEDACVPLGKSRRRVDEIIQEGKKSAVSADSNSEEKLETLKTVSELPVPREEEPEKPRVKTADEVIADNAEKNGESFEVLEERAGLVAPPFKPSLDLSVWTSKVLKLFEAFPKSKLYNKLAPETIKTFESSLASLYSVLGEFLPQKPQKILCKCGCGLSAEVSERLFRVGVPCKGLTPGQAGIIMKKMADNEWTLPRYFSFLKNEGEWVERQFKGKPAK